MTITTDQQDRAPFQACYRANETVKSRANPQHRHDGHQKLISRLGAPTVRAALRAAMNTEISLCLDAEESDRLELSLDLLERVLDGELRYLP